MQSNQLTFFKKIKSYFISEKAASATEFALLAPILILLIIGIIDFGSFIKTKMRVQNAAHSVAEYVVQTQSDTDVNTIVSEVFNDPDTELELTTSFECECADGTIAECPLDCGLADYERRFINVRADAEFKPLFPYPGIPESLDISALVRMRAQ